MRATTAPSWAGPTAAVLARAAREGRRDPGPALVLPALPSLLLAVALTAQFDRLGEVVDFGGGSFEAYVVPGLVLFAALAAGGFSSAQLALDLRSGFVDRLRLHLGGPLPLLAGRFAFEALRVVPAALAILAAGLALGGRNTNGLPGLAAVVALTMLLSTAFSGLFFVVATRTQDPQTPLNLQPVGIVLYFVSSAIVPPEAMPGWTEALARANPVTAIADGARAAMVGDLASAEVLVAFAVAAALAAAAVAGAVRVLSSAIGAR